MNPNNQIINTEEEFKKLPPEQQAAIEMIGQTLTGEEIALRLETIDPHLTGE